MRGCIRFDVFTAALSHVRQTTSSTIYEVSNSNFDGAVVASLKNGATPWSWQVLQQRLEPELLCTPFIIHAFIVMHAQLHLH